MRWLLIAAVMVAGCGPLLPEPPCDIEPTPGVCVGLDRESSPPDSTLKVEAWRLAIEKSAAFWRIGIDSLRGLRIGLATHVIDCGGIPALGCIDRKARIIWLAALDGCPEYALPHEIGHLVIDDCGHSDERWYTLRAWVLLHDLPACRYDERIGPIVR